MELNIIDIINRNEFFLKKLFPQGLINTQLGRINLFFEDKIELSIYSKQKPAFSPPKWGEWGVNYTTIVVLISGHFIKNIQIHNWQNNKLRDCKISIQKNEDVFSILFSGENWDVVIELESLIYQESSVYIDDNDLELP